ncbi:flagellar protein FlgN [Candidatus Fukatsuia symbiotica]|uniref:Flagellar protein FlgN n=1 Tax=Candidatus Fukatsuia symbiotica TaxID=1878942 RepID=A0A2U8I9B4_9GAMM|nr:flagellar protein FlgN [Candidatus Fukatsuia symbiotica]AWK14614.1 hypothetical protein CCS41_09235 [Candidatus Fukatsuia symbiotica]MEA9444924.1 flagellar protein FlgN [Candidatus Fukatsuia symbiotica]
MNATQSLKQLLLTIQSDRKHYISLDKLLLTQRQCMITCNATKLLAVNERLSEIYHALSQTATERLALLKKLKVTADSKGMQILFQRLPEQYREHVTALWADLEQRVLSCQQKNLSNGKLISMQHDIFAPLLGYKEAFLYAG